MNVVILGAGPIGLATAMLLARDGHEVSVFEKDPQPPPATADEVWSSWDRKGVAQFRQTHLVHARFRHIVDAELPAVRDQLFALGARPFNPIGPATMRLDDPSSREGDERFETIAARRPVLEAAFAHVAEDTIGVKITRGIGVEGPITREFDGLRHVTGVRLSSGEVVEADLVIDATGRRSRLPEWLAAMGARPLYEEASDTGYAYYTRFYSSPDGSLPEYRGGIVGSAESFSVLTVPSDNNAWTIAVVAMAGDHLLKKLRHNDAWERVVRSIPHIAHWIDAEPVDDVLPMAGAMDRYRRIVVDGAPVVTGIVPIGDAWSCTNPTAGRGISLGLMHACAFRDTLREHGDDPAALAVEFDRVTEERLTPWYRQQVERDQRRSLEIQAAIDGATPPRSEHPMAKMQLAFVTGAGRDPELARAFMDNMSVLALPPEIMSRPGIIEKVMQYADEPPPRPMGPTRAELATILA